MKLDFEFLAGEMQIAYLRKAENGQLITNSAEAAKILRPYFAPYMEHREAFFALFMNRNNNVISCARISEGGQSGTIADPKIIFQNALLCNAASIILAHNHPSGNTEPSRADRDLTKKMKEAGNVLDIAVLDHIILTQGGYFSFGDEGLI